MASLHWENNRLLDYYKIISISRPILARDNMGIDFVSGQYGNAHVLICKYLFTWLVCNVSIYELLGYENKKSLKIPTG